MQISRMHDGPRVRRGGRLAALVTGAVILSSGVLAATAMPAAADDCSTVPWMDTSKSSEERANALLDASTQHQKYRWLVEQPANDPQRTTWNGGVVYPVQVPCTPVVIYANGPDGVYTKAGTTAWPGPIAVASTWNLELGEEKAVAHGSESFDSRSAVVLGPGIASGRTPLSGRGSEYFGEDALLSGMMAAANVRGLEHGNTDKPVVANLKHYVANEQEIDRQTSSSNIEERAFRQVYDLPYEIAVKESDPGSVMCSYNQVNGVYACERLVLGRRDAGDRRRGDRVVEQALLDVGVHHVECGLVDLVLRDLPCGERCVEPHRRVPDRAVELLVEAGVERCGGRVHRTEVAHHVTVEAHLL
ncbi:MAG TPA: glycoside hydrolase family 3 N-terminal domain-containing protein, partial [Microbacterium sp.]|nr:glycoside hydrolase family 3 N-terminal domain-containing protein [Microbacterium sp.]